MMAVPYDALKPHERAGYRFPDLMNIPKKSQDERRESYGGAIGPGQYDPNINATHKTATSKKMLFRPPEKMDRSGDEPGPGQYSVHDMKKVQSFKICEDIADKVSRKQKDPMKKIPKEELLRQRDE